MDPSQPRAGGPRHRRSFTPAQKLEHLAAYEAAVAQGSGGAYLRQEGLYSSQITEWRKPAKVEPVGRICLDAAVAMLDR